MTSRDPQRCCEAVQSATLFDSLAFCMYYRASAYEAMQIASEWSIRISCLSQSDRDCFLGCSGSTEAPKDADDGNTAQVIVVRQAPGVQLLLPVRSADTYR